MSSRISLTRLSTRLARLCGLVVTVMAGTVFAAATPMGYDDARHLLARTGFGPTDAEVRAYAALTRDDAIEQLLASARSTPVTAPPAWALETDALRAPRPDTATEQERKDFRQKNIREGLLLRAWWVQEMLDTPSPLTERMTLFWHNHFVSSQQKVRFARLMYQQNATFRANALGNFGTLLHAASKEPAMLLYLDSAQNRRGQPNENFAREVMELFTLGEGRYGENDVKEAARAFTGWSIERERYSYLFRPLQHDIGPKTVLGVTGPLNGDQVLDILLAQPATADFITAKLWREFVSPEPAAREVSRAAKRFRESGYDIKVVLRALLQSDAFWAGENRGTLVKSPVELVVGTLRQLEVEPGTALPFAVVSSAMGQSLFSPPNVKGWPGGEVWINSNTLLARKQFLDRVARAADGVRPVDVPAMMATSRDAANGIATSNTMASSNAMNGNVASGTDERKGDGVDAARKTLVPPGPAEDEAARAFRLAQQLDRGVRSLNFDADHWLRKREGDTRRDKMQAAQALLLPLPPERAPTVMSGPSGDALAFVHATLLDPAYQLK